jgi:hypothetical protein
VLLVGVIAASLAFIAALAFDDEAWRGRSAAIKDVAGLTEVR